MKSPGLMLCWATSRAAGRAAPPLAAPLLRSRTSPGLWFTCGQSQRCSMLGCHLACSELVFSGLFPMDGSHYSRNTKPVAVTAAGRLSRGTAPSPCLPVGSLARLPACHHLCPCAVTRSRYKWSATGLISQQLHCFTPTGDPGQGDCGRMSRSADAAPFSEERRDCRPDLLPLHQPERRHRSTGAGETCTVRRFFFIIPPCQSGTF